MIPSIDLSNVFVAGIRVHVFGLLLVTAVVVGHTVFVRRVRSLGVGGPGDADAFAIVTVGAGMLAASAEAAIRSEGAASVASGLAGIELSSVKGFAAAIIAGALFLRIRKLDARSFADAAAYAAPFAWFFARLGCAAAHDHLGRPSSSWLAVRFPSGPRLDMGLLEWMCTPLLVGLVVVVSKRALSRGVMAGALAVAYAILRFLLDFLRAEDLGSRGDTRYSELTAAQWGAAPLLALGILLLLTAKEAPEDPKGPEAPLRKAE